MIKPKTSKLLGLKPITKNMCSDFYKKIISEFNTPEEIKEAISWWQDDCEKLNSLWWVLNYYSDALDSDRLLRAKIERDLDKTARRKEEISSQA